jgi:hypothetical protein
MIDLFLQKWTESRRARFSRAIAGICVALWLTGSVSMLYGNIAPQWTTPHCPQSHSHSTQPTHGACAWYCASIDTHSDSCRPWSSALTQAGFSGRSLSASFDITVFNGWMSPRGPPNFTQNLLVV